MFSLLREELEKTLKPCPCCGGEARIAEEHYINFTTGYQIVCCKCYVQTLRGDMNVNEAIKTWNKRVGEDNG